MGDIFTAQGSAIRISNPDTANQIRDYVKNNTQYGLYFNDIINYVCSRDIIVKDIEERRRTILNILIYNLSGNPCRYFDIKDVFEDMYRIDVVDRKVPTESFILGLAAAEVILGGTLFPIEDYIDKFPAHRWASSVDSRAWKIVSKHETIDNDYRIIHFMYLTEVLDQFFTEVFEPFDPDSKERLTLDIGYQANLISIVHAPSLLASALTYDVMNGLRKYRQKYNSIDQTFTKFDDALSIFELILSSFLDPDFKP